jgi:hypothetical protein
MDVILFGTFGHVSIMILGSGSTCSEEVFINKNTFMKFNYYLGITIEVKFTKFNGT